MSYGDNIGSIGRFPTTHITIEPSNTHRQVYNLTHETNGTRNSYMNRAFISFSFGGKYIEDFGLVVANSGDRMERSLSGDFNDLTSQYDVVEGQYYWGTYFTKNQMSFNLVSDGVEQEQLDDFKVWFAPGQTRELILSEHPNRAIMARISEPPIMTMLPFEEKTEVTVNDSVYETSTTLYKGEIQLSFVMDEPFWYAKMNLLSKSLSNNGIWADVWTGANGQDIIVCQDKDALKIIKEDRIPTPDMIAIQQGIQLGGNVFSNISGTNTALIQTDILNNPNATDNGKIGLAVIGPILSPNSGRSSMTNRDSGYIYYAGTAPTRPLLKFSFTLQSSNFSNYFVTSPSNSYYSTSTPYNTFTLTCNSSQTLKLTAPEAFLSYNCAQKLIDSCTSYTQLREQLREQVTHTAARKWAFKAVDYAETVFPSTYQKYDTSGYPGLKTCMRYFLMDTTHTFLLDGKSGRMLGILGYKLTTNSIPSRTSWASYGTINDVEEDISNVVVSDFLTFNERNYPNSRGQIVAWSSSDKGTSYVFSHNFAVTLNNVTFIFDNYYY